MCRQAKVRRHDGLRTEGRSPYVGLRDSLRTAEKKLGGRKSYFAAEHHNEAAPKKRKNWGVEKVILPPNTITRRCRKKKKKKKAESFPLGRLKIRLQGA